MFKFSSSYKFPHWLASAFVSIILLLSTISFLSPTQAQTEEKPIYGAVFRLAKFDENDIRLAFAYPDGTWTTQKLPAVFDYSSIEYSVNRPHWLRDGRLIGTGFAEEPTEISWDMPRSRLYIYDPFAGELNMIGDGTLTTQADGTPDSWHLVRISPDERYAVLSTSKYLEADKLIIVNLETETIVAKFDDVYLSILDIQGTQFLFANVSELEFWLIDVLNPAAEVRVIPDIHHGSILQGYILNDSKLLLTTYDSIKLIDSAHDFTEIWTLPNVVNLKLSEHRNLIAAYSIEERKLVWADIPNDSVGSLPVDQLMPYGARHDFDVTSALVFSDDTLVYWEETDLGTGGDSCLILRHEYSIVDQIKTSIPYYAQPEQPCGQHLSISPHWDALIEYMPESGEITVHQAYSPANLPTDQTIVDVDGTLFEASAPLWSSADLYPGEPLSLANLYAAEPVPVWNVPTFTRDGNWLYLYQRGDNPNYVFINIYNGSSYYLTLPYSEHYRYITSSPDEQWFVVEKRDLTTGQATYSVVNPFELESEILVEAEYGIMSRPISEVDLYYFVEWSPIWIE